MKIFIYFLMLVMVTFDVTANNGRLEVKNGIITLYVEATQTEYACNANGSYLFPINELKTKYDLDYSNKVLNDTMAKLTESNNKLKLNEDKYIESNKINHNLMQENLNLKSRNEVYYSLIIGSGIAVVIMIMLMAHIVKRKNDNI